jgi:hypothetical protein
MQIGIQNGKLVCSPLGHDSGVTLTFDDFTYANEGSGEEGWWHISCSYSKEDNAVVGVIYNRAGRFTSSIISKSISSSATFPEDGVMFGFFGHEGDLYDTAH